MKKAVILVMIISAVLSFFSCDYHKLNHNISLPKYIREECHWGEGFQDYTHYCKYYYDEESINKFESHKKFKKVMYSDIENIKSYFEDFNRWVEKESYCEKYDFNFLSQVKEGDYFCIVTKEGEKIGDGYYEKFDSYNVYYVDMSMNILYFIHSNT